MIEIVDFPWTLFLTSKCIYMFLIWSGSFGYNYDLIFIIISNNFSFKYHQNWVLEDLRLRWSNESTIYTYFLPSNHSENHKYLVREKGPNKPFFHEVGTIIYYEATSLYSLCHSFMQPSKVCQGGGSSLACKSPQLSRGEE